MTKRFIFDVDGTLTPSRGQMNYEFQKWFTNFQEHKFLVKSVNITSSFTLA